MVPWNTTKDLCNVMSVWIMWIILFTHMCYILGKLASRAKSNHLKSMYFKFRWSFNKGPNKQEETHVEAWQVRTQLIVWPHLGVQPGPNQSGWCGPPWEWCRPFKQDGTCTQSLSYGWLHTGWVAASQPWGFGCLSHPTWMGGPILGGGHQLG